MAISLTVFNPNSKAQSSQVNGNFTNISNAIRPVYGFGLDQVLSVGANQTLITLITHSSLTLVKAYAVVKTAPTGANLIIDINKNGSSIWSSNPSNRLTVSAGATTGSQTSFDSTTFAEGDQLTLDIDQIGSTVAGTSLTVILKFEHN